MKTERKNLLKRIASWGGAMILSLGIGSGVGYTISDCGYTRDDYADNKQIEYLTEGLGVDTSYMMSRNGNFYRLAHNDGEPIPVTFEEGYDTRVKEIAIKTLDYAFGLMQDINPLYNYKLVSNEEFKKKGIGTNAIKYSIKTQKELTSMNAIAQANSTSITKKANRIIKCEVFFCKERIETSSDESVFYSLLHELMHLFGSKDVYFDTKENPNNIIYNNTIMNTATKNDAMYSHQHFSPNDYNNLLAIYSPKCETNEELKNILDTCLTKSKQYQDEYYKCTAEELKQSYSLIKFKKCDDIENLNISKSFSMDGAIYADVDMEVNGDKFKIVTSAENGEFLNKDITEGKVLKYSDFIVLKQVEMDRCYSFKGFKPFRGDFILLCLDNTDNVVVFDLYQGYFGMFKIDELKHIQENQPQSLISKNIKKNLNINLQKLQKQEMKNVYNYIAEIEM